MQSMAKRKVSLILLLVWAVGRKDAPATVDPVQRYRHFEKAFLDGELDAAFKDLSVWDMRMVVNGEEPDEMLAWGREMLRNYRPDHITTPDYRWRYVGAVRTDVKYGSQDCQYDQDELQFFQNVLMNGGVCGRRAFFGRFILRAFGVRSDTPEFWNGVALLTQRQMIETAGAKALAAVGTDIGEAKVSKKKEIYTAVKMSDAGRMIAIGRDGVVTIPAAATTKPETSTGRILFTNSVLGGKQLHYGRNSGAQDFEYAVQLPAAGRDRRRDDQAVHAHTSATAVKDGTDNGTGERAGMAERIISPKAWPVLPTVPWPAGRGH